MDRITAALAAGGEAAVSLARALGALLLLALLAAGFHARRRLTEGLDAG